MTPTGQSSAPPRPQIRPEDSAHTLYGRLLELEVEFFRTAWPLLASGSPPRQTQSPDEGSNHKRADLASDSIRRLDLEASVPVRETLRTLRALTTNDVEEAAYFEVDGRRYRVQVTITPESGEA